MTVSITPYFSWSGSGINSNVAPYNACSPNLVQIQAYCHRAFGGVRSLGCHVPPPSSTKSHPYGAANDLRFNGGRPPTLQAIDFLIAHSAELGVNTIHDYFDNQRMWKPLIGWTYNAPIGSPGGTWIHVETTPAAFGDSRPVEDRLTGSAEGGGEEPMTPEDRAYLEGPYKDILANDTVRILRSPEFQVGFVDDIVNATSTKVDELTKLVKSLALVAGDPDAVKAAVREIVREELDKTHLQAGPS